MPLLSKKFKNKFQANFPKTAPLNLSHEAEALKIFRLLTESDWIFVLVNNQEFTIDQRSRYMIFQRIKSLTNDWWS